MSGDIGYHYCRICGFGYQPCVHLRSAPPWYGSVEGPNHATNGVAQFNRDAEIDRLRAELADANKTLDANAVLIKEQLAELAALRAERDALRAEVELWKERAYQLSHA